MNTDIVLRDESTVLTLIESGHTALMEAKTISETKDVRDRAAAIESYVRQRDLSLEAEFAAGELRLRAQRQLGVMLEETIERGRPVKGDTMSPLSDLGIQKKQSSRWQNESRIPEPEFESYLKDTWSKKERLSSNGLVRHRGQSGQQATPPALPGTYSVILADPPWRYEHSVSTSRDIENQYPTMSLQEICDLEKDGFVKSADDCILFLWATSPKLAECMQVIEAWGFNYRTCMVWIKDKIGMGYYARQRHELLLIATKGDIKTPEPSDRPDSVIEAPRGVHSAKPERAYELIEQMYPGYSYCEMFNRQKRDGWEPWS